MTKQQKKKHKDPAFGASAEEAKAPLRLEWIEAGSLTDNPANWRRHSMEQLETLREVLKDPDVGWAGACLFNERTGRLIDGHARKEVADDSEMIPVLVGSWSEEGEKKILASLDPLTAMATGDRDEYAKLAEGVEAEGLWLRDLLHNTRAGLAEVRELEMEVEAGFQVELEDMECQPFEHYDYIMLLFRSDHDFQRACELLEIKRVQIRYPGGLKKIGLGRCVDGAAAIKKLLTSPPEAASSAGAAAAAGSLGYIK